MLVVVLSTDVFLYSSSCCFISFTIDCASSINGALSAFSSLVLKLATTSIILFLNVSAVPSNCLTSVIAFSNSASVGIDLEPVSNVSIRLINFSFISAYLSTQSLNNSLSNMFSIFLESFLYDCSFSKVSSQY